MGDERPDFQAAFDSLLSEGFEDTVAQSTLRARRNLLVACLIGSATAVTGLDVLEVTLAGATGEIEINKLLSILVFVIAYLQTHFFIYSYSDLKTRKIKLHKRRSAARRALHKIRESSKEEVERIRALPNAISLLDDPGLNSLSSAKDSFELAEQSNRSSEIRMIFDIWAPHVIAIFSIALIGSILAGMGIFYALFLILALILVSALVYAAIKRKIFLAYLKRIRRDRHKNKVAKIAGDLRTNKPTGEELKRLQDKARSSLIKSLGLTEEEGDN